MKSAEEFADSLFDYEGGEKWREHSAALIRARDKEIVEVCKAQAVGYMRIKGLCAHEYESYDCPVCQQEMKDSLDSVLRDLEGGHDVRN